MGGQRLVVCNAARYGRRVTVGSGTVAVRALRVNDTRVAAEADAVFTARAGCDP